MLGSGFRRAFEDHEAIVDRDAEYSFSLLGFSCLGFISNDMIGCGKCNQSPTTTFSVSTFTGSLDEHIYNYNATYRVYRY